MHTQSSVLVSSYIFVYCFLPLSFFLSLLLYFSFPLVFNKFHSLPLPWLFRSLSTLPSFSSKLSSSSVSSFHSFTYICFFEGLTKQLDSAGSDRVYFVVVEKMNPKTLFTVSTLSSLCTRAPDGFAVSHVSVGTQTTTAFRLNVWPTSCTTALWLTVVWNVFIRRMKSYWMTCWKLRLIYHAA